MLLELTQAANNLDEAKLESELADRSLWQAEENRRVSKSQYEVGLETLSDHLEAQALWQQAYETQVDARFQLYLNYVAYLKAAGTYMTNCKSLYLSFWFFFILGASDLFISFIHRLLDCIRGYIILYFRIFIRMSLLVELW